jgi:hypothetical protein
VLIQCTPTSFLPDDGRNDPIMLEWCSKGYVLYLLRLEWPIRPVYDKVEWWKLIWHKHVIPRFSFILWIAIHDALLRIS